MLNIFWTKADVKKKKNCINQSLASFYLSFLFERMSMNQIEVTRKGQRKNSNSLEFTWKLQVKGILCDIKSK